MNANQRSKLQAIIKDEIKAEDLHGTTRKNLEAMGFIDPKTGIYTEEGLRASGLPFKEVPTIRFGSDRVVLGKTIPKGSTFMVAWTHRPKNKRRDWYTIILLPEQDQDGGLVRLPITHSPRDVYGDTAILDFEELGLDKSPEDAVN